MRTASTGRGKRRTPCLHLVSVPTTITAIPDRQLSRRRADDDGCVQLPGCPGRRIPGSAVIRTKVCLEACISVSIRLVAWATAAPVAYTQSICATSGCANNTTSATDDAAASTRAIANVCVSQ